MKYLLEVDDKKDKFLQELLSHFRFVKPSPLGEEFNRKIFDSTTQLRFTRLHSQISLPRHCESLFQKILIENCKQFPIKVISLKEQKPFSGLVDKIIAQKQKDEDIKINEAQIDKMVYELYHITEEEQKLIEWK